MNNTLHLYGIPNCDTVKKARTWLAERAVTVEFHDFKKQGVPAAELDRWLAALGWEMVLNRQGTTWRKLDEATRAEVGNAEQARAVMLAHPSVIKRPVLAWPDGSFSVGFDPAGWQTRLP